MRPPVTGEGTGFGVLGLQPDAIGDEIASALELGGAQQGQADQAAEAA